MSDRVLNTQKQPPEMFFKIGLLKNFSNFTWKRQCLNLFFFFFFCNFIKKTFQRRCSPVKFAKFLRTLSLQNTSGASEYVYKIELHVIVHLYMVKVQQYRVLETNLMDYQKSDFLDIIR